MTTLLQSVSSAPPTEGDWVIEFIEGLCRQTEGEHAGAPITLEEWQKDLIRSFFVVRPDGRRRYRQGLWGLPRKNGKSSLGASIALYLLLMDGEQGAEVYSCAGDRDQARIVFGTAKRMVELEPALSDRLTLYRDVIEDKRTNSIYRVLSAEAYTKEGLNPSGVIFDELHVQPTRELWDVMTMGSGTRRQPLVLAITTAGYDLDGTICGEKYTYGKKVQSGEVDDPTFFFRWWEPSRPDCDWRDPAVWAECNPALGQFLYLEDLEQAARQVPENTFRRYRLNQWVAVRDTWLPYGAWDACLDRTLDLDPALPLMVGVDVGLRHDSSAVSAAQKQNDRTVVRCRIWQNPYPEGHVLHDSWKMDIVEIENYLRELRTRFPVPACKIDDEVKAGPAFYYDPAFFERSAQILEGEGLAMVEMPQTDGRMIPISQQAYQLIVERNLAHDGDPALKAHVENVTADQKPRGAWRMSKPRGSRKKIDGAIATAIAAWAAQQPVPVPPQSIYETRGLLTI